MQGWWDLNPNWFSKECYWYLATVDGALAGCSYMMCSSYIRDVKEMNQ